MNHCLLYMDKDKNKLASNNCRKIVPTSFRWFAIFKHDLVVISGSSFNQKNMLEMNITNNLEKNYYSALNKNPRAHYFMESST